MRANPILSAGAERSTALRASRSHELHSTKLTALANNDLDSDSCIESSAGPFPLCKKGNLGLFSRRVNGTKVVFTLGPWKLKSRF
jgi:hypothetical protein